MEDKEVVGLQPAFTPTDIDGAYFLGVFNSGGIDALIREAERIKSLGYHPHQIIQLLKNSEP